MVRTIFEKILALRPPLRSLIFLYWIYSFAGSMVGVFTQIFLYQKFTSISLNITATLIFYTGIMVGFCIPGLFAAAWRVNIKHGFMWSFLIMGASILYLLHIMSVNEAFIAMFFWGIGQGVFWLTVNTFELSETEESERDFYSSVLNAGNQVLSLIGPASAALLIWLSGTVLHLGTYTLLFSVAPTVFLLGFLCFSNIREYRPQPIQWADVKYFFTDRKNQAAQLYTLGTGFQQTLGLTVPPLVILLILGSSLRVGVYNTFFAIFTAICILVIAQYRTSSNRLKIYGITTAGLVLVTILFGYFFSFTALIIYTLIEGILSPIQNVSSHVIDLGAMEIGRSESDFYATMILRDFFLWASRCLGGVVFLFIISFVGTDKSALSIGLYFLAGGLLCMYFGALFLDMARRKTNL